MGEKEETGRRNGLFIKADRKKTEAFTKTMCDRNGKNSQ